MRDRLHDKDRLLHMIEAINQLQSMTTDEWESEIKKNHLLYFSLVKLLEIMGEAAYMITNDFKASHPDLYWQAIADLRHVMVHGYYKIQLSRLIRTINDDLPYIKDKVKAYIDELTE